MYAIHMRMLVMYAATIRSTRRSPWRPKNVWGKPCLPAARFHTYSDTHELELHGRSWRCRWCLRSGKDLIQDCTGERPKIKATFSFRMLSKKGRKKARGKTILGRKKAPRRAGVQQRRQGAADAANASMRKVWPSLPPPVLPPNTDPREEANTRVAAIQGERDSHPFGRPPERGGGH